jgi:hypothetical protein
MSVAGAACSLPFGGTEILESIQIVKTGKIENLLFIIQEQQESAISSAADG